MIWLKIPRASANIDLDYQTTIFISNRTVDLISKRSSCKFYRHSSNQNNLHFMFNNSFVVQTFSEIVPDGNTVSTTHFPLYENVLIIDS
jgi:hypothetical protein